MRELKHALTGGIYGIDPEDGLVRIEEVGKVGWFGYRRRWQRGDASAASRTCRSSSPASRPR